MQASTGTAAAAAGLRGGGPAIAWAIAPGPSMQAAAWPQAAVLALWLALAAPAGAGPDDPLRSAACTQALAALHRQETLSSGKTLAAAVQAASAPATEPASGAGAAPDPALPALRRAALSACLMVAGHAAPPVLARPPPAARLGQQPGAAPPPVGVSPGGADRVRAPAVVVPLPRTLTACDATGCWTNDGQRLLRAGGGLLGPGGWCRNTTGALDCP